MKEWLIEHKGGFNVDCTAKNEYGKISVTEEVIATVAGVSAVDCYGIVAMASKRATDGIVELLGSENITRGVKTKIVDDKISVDLFIIVQYGVSIAAVARSAMETVKYNIENLTGMPVVAVNITVEGIRVEGKK